MHDCFNQISNQNITSLELQAMAGYPSIQRKCEQASFIRWYWKSSIEYQVFQGPGKIWHRSSEI